MNTDPRKTTRRPFTVTSEDTPVTQSWHAANMERERIIMGFSDCELLKFHHIGGAVPRQMQARLNRVLMAFIETVASEARKAEPDPFEGYGPEAGCTVPWVESSSVARHQRNDHKRSVRRKAGKRITAFLSELDTDPAYSLGNLLGGGVVARKSA